MAQEKDSKDNFSGLRQRAEETLGGKSSDIEDISALSPDEIQRLVHELRVHQIEMEMQNEDLRQAQIKLEELKDRYLDLYDFAPVGYVTLNEKGIILEANLTAVRLLGEERQTLIKRPFSRFVCKESGDAYYYHLQQVFETQSKQTCEIKLSRKDGSHFWAQQESIAVQDENGQFNRCRTVVSDISERMEAQSALRESEELHRLTISGMSDTVLITDDRGDFTYVCPNTHLVFGFSQQEVQDLGNVLKLLGHELFDPSQLEQVGEIRNIECTIVDKSGKDRSLLVNVKIVDIKGGRFLYTCRDTTELKRSEATLRESEGRLSRISSMVSDIAYSCIKPPSGAYSIDWLTGGGEHLTGCSVDELKSLGCWRSLVVDDDLPLFDNHVIGLAPGTTGSCELRLRHKNGEIMWISSFAECVVDPESPDTLVLYGGLVDITDRKRAEEELRKTSEYLEKLIGYANAPIIVWVPEFKITRFNRAFETLTGRKAEDVIGHSLEILFPPDRVEPSMELIHRTLSGERWETVEISILNIDGSIRTVLWNSATILAADGLTPAATIAQGVDITERKQAEEALRERDKQYRNLFEESIDGVSFVLRDGTITDANPSFCELFGYTREEMIGKDARELYFDPADRQRFQKEIEKKGFVKDYEIRFRRRDGTEIDALFTAVVQFADDGSVVGHRGILRDMTERKALQKQLLQAQKMEAVGALASGVAHDFNNLLQVVLGYSELVLSDEDLPYHLRDDLGRVLLAGRNGADLVQRLLTFSRKTETKPLNLDLNQRIRQTQKFLQRTIPKMIDIELILEDDLARIHTDPTQMDQVLMNLAVNARDAMPDGGKLTVITQNVTLDEEYCRLYVLGATPGDYVLLKLSDTGQGMDEETVERIFEPFFTTKEIGRGTGLGLAMVHGIVKQNNGHITVYSEVGKGTTFRVYFPAIEGDVEPDVGPTGIMPAFGTETVLLVDDEEFVRDLGKRILERSGYTVLTAVNGKEALELYKREREKISLVILDLVMPEMGGQQCLEDLLRIDPKARVLIASGYAVDGQTKEALETGARGSVGKPFDMRQMLQAVREVLDSE